MVPSPVMIARHRKTSSPPWRTDFEAPIHEKATSASNTHPTTMLGSLKSSDWLAVTNSTGHARLAAEPTRVRARGSSTARSWMMSPQTITINGNPKPLSKPASPRMAASRLGHMSHSAPVSKANADILVRRSSRCCRCAPADSMAVSTSAQASTMQPTSTGWS